VHDWVATLLASKVPFFLYTTPPPTGVQRSDVVTIEDARMVPAVVLYLGWGTDLQHRISAPDQQVAAAYLTPTALALATGPHAFTSVGESVNMASLIASESAGGASVRDADQRPSSSAAVRPSVMSDAMIDAMAARLLGGGPAQSLAAQAQTAGPAQGPSRTVSKPSWLKTGGSK
jgi:hypothetical protein